MDNNLKYLENGKLGIDCPTCGRNCTCRSNEGGLYKIMSEGSGGDIVAKSYRDYIMSKLRYSGGGDENYGLSRDGGYNSSKGERYDTGRIGGGSIKYDGSGGGDGGGYDGATSGSSLSKAA